MQVPHYSIHNADNIQNQLRVNLYRQLIWVAYVCIHVDDEEVSVHEARKGFKRLRALVRLFRNGIGEPTYRRLNLYFRNKARRLAPYRDLSVNLQLINRLINESQNNQETKPLIALKSHLLKSYDELQSEGHLAVLLKNVADEVLDYAPQVFSLKVKPLGTSMLITGVGEIYRCGRKEYQKVIYAPTSENFHQLRKRVKYLKYHMDLLEIWGGGTLGNNEKLADEVADLLGLEHDAAILLQLVELHASLFTSGEKNHWLRLIKQNMDRYHAKAWPILAYIYFDKPKVFLRRMQLALDCGLRV